MKTSELKKWLDENEWGYIEKEDFINVEDIKIYKKIGMLDIPNGLAFGVGSYTSMMLQKAIEYLETPISKREDEKKYKIELCEICEGVLSKEEMRTVVYSMSSRIQSTLHQKIIFKEVFTQSEVDNFPEEIKGAIECGFLRKMEVQ